MQSFSAAVGTNTVEHCAGDLSAGFRRRPCRRSREPIGMIWDTIASESSRAVGSSDLICSKKPQGRKERHVCSGCCRGCEPSTAQCNLLPAVMKSQTTAGPWCIRRAMHGATSQPEPNPKNTRVYEPVVYTSP